MQKWEYKIDRLYLNESPHPDAEKDREQQEEYINVLGSEGWELVSVQQWEVQLVDRKSWKARFIFKRPKEP